MTVGLPSQTRTGHTSQILVVRRPPSIRDQGLAEGVSTCLYALYWSMVNFY